MTGIPLKGTVQDTGLANILSHLNRNRKTGTLVVTTPVFTKRVFLLKGDAIFASSTYEDDRLGEMLLKAGNITMEQYDAAVQILKKTRKRLGAILVELGYLIPKDLFWGVKYQVQEIIYSLFLLEDATYEFVEGDIPSDEVITLKMSMGNLIYEGIRRIDNWTRIRKEMPPADTVLKLSSDPVALFQDVELSSQDRKMLSIIDGTKTMKEILSSAWIGSFEGMKILYVLWSIGVIEVKTKKPEKPVPEKAIPLEEILQPVPEDEYSFLAKVDELYQNLDSFSPSQLLNLDDDADEETKKKSYYKLTREFHPDRSFGTADPSLKDKLTAIFDALTNAYAQLQAKAKPKTIPQQKAVSPQKPASLQKPVSSQKPVSPKKPDAGLSAAAYFKKGVEEFKKGDFNSAVSSFSSATSAEPGNAKYWSYLALSCTKLPERLQNAERALLKAIELEPGNADHYANLGMIYAVQNNKKKAAEQFQRALSINPSDVKAQKGLAQIKKA